MQINQLREEYINYIAEFDKKLKSKKIFKENGLFYEETPEGGRNPLIRLTYSEWLLERILLSFTSFNEQEKIQEARLALIKEYSKRI